MRKHWSIIFPNHAGIDIILYNYYNGQRRALSLKEAKDIILSALLRGDIVMNDEDKKHVEITNFVGELITIVDKSEWEIAAAKIKEETL